MKRNFMTLLIAGGVGFSVAMVLSFIFRGDFGHGLIVACVLIYIVLPLMLIAGIIFIVGRLWHRKWLSWILTVALALMAFSSVQVVSMPIGWYLQEGDVRLAREYCEQLIPLLKAHKEQAGSYPKLPQSAIVP